MGSELRVIIFNSFINLLLAGLKSLTGIIFHNQLLLADGINTLADLLNDGVSALGLKLSHKPGDAMHPFGHGKWEYAAALTISMIIFFIVFNLIKDFFAELHQLQEQVDPLLIVVAAVALVVKYMMGVYTLKRAKEMDSLTLENSGIDSKADALSTVLVIGGLLLKMIGLKFDIHWLLYGEKVATLCVIAILAKAAFTIYRNTILGLAGSPASEEVNQRFAGVLAEHFPDLRVQKLMTVKEGVDYSLIIRLTFDCTTPLTEVDRILKAVKKQLLSVEHITRVALEFDVAG